MARRRDAAEPPTTHTAVIDGVEAMFWKLAWDVDQFNDLQRYGVEDAEPLAYAAINVCIASVSLRDWACAEYLKRQRSAGTPATEEEVWLHMRTAVLQLPMCEAIANTAKHSRVHSGKWPGGSVRIDLDEADEDGPGGFVLRHVHADGQYTSIGLNAFMNMEQNWWGELQTLGFAFPRTPPEWKQRKIRKIFGPYASGSTGDT